MPVATAHDSGITRRLARANRTGIARSGVRLLAAIGLAVDAYVHADLAHTYTDVHATVGEATLFRLESAIAAASAVALIVSQRRVVLAVAAVVASSAFGAVMLYRYVDLGALGPLPNMYEPTWFTEKAVSAASEAVAAVVLVGLLVTSHRKLDSQATSGGGPRSARLDAPESSKCDRRPASR